MPAPRYSPPRALSPEIPVVSYPTPNLDDLVVVLDVDSRLPGYQPAQYGDLHPDQTTYPGLKLVHQAPLDQETSHMWVRRIYANDRADQDAYNYALKYSSGASDKPIYIRTYVLPRADYAPLAKGSPDPADTGDPATTFLVDEEVQRIDDQSLDSLFVKVARVYETLPGPGLTTTRRGSLQSIPAKFQVAMQVTTTKTEVLPDTAPDDPSDTVVESSVEQSSVAKALKVTSAFADGSTTSLTGTQTGMWGIESVVDTLVRTTDTANRAATGVYKKKSESSDPLGDGRFVKHTVNYPSSPAVLKEVHTDETYRIPVYMEKSLVNPSSSLPTTLSSGASLPEGATIERHAIDPWNSIQIISYVNESDLPTSETWSHAMNYSFPDQLTAAGIYFSLSHGSHTAAGGVNPSIAASSSWSAEASANASASLRAVPYVTTKSGYSGPCRASSTRSFSMGPPSAPTITPTVITPVTGAIVITGTGESVQSANSLSGAGTQWSHTSGSYGRNSDVIATRFTFGPVLHNLSALTFKNVPSSGTDLAVSSTSSSCSVTRSSGAASGGSVPSGTYPAASAEADAKISAALELPASSHTGFSSGDTIVVSSRTEKWRFGIWITETTTITHP